MAEGRRNVPDLAMLIDANEFHHEFGEGVMYWRDEHIIPRYNAAGVTRFAFLVPASTRTLSRPVELPLCGGPGERPHRVVLQPHSAYKWPAE
jgi:hypothetical protein